MGPLIKELRHASVSLDSNRQFKLAHADKCVCVCVYHVLVHTPFLYLTSVVDSQEGTLELYLCKYSTFHFVFLPGHGTPLRRSFPALVLLDPAVVGPCLGPLPLSEAFLSFPDGY